MIVDTNVVSEMVRPRPDERVVRWFEVTDARRFWLAAPVLAEVLTGIAMLPPGRRQRTLDAAMRSALARIFQGRFLAFDRAAASAYATLVAAARRAGTAVSMGDAQIAAIATVHALPVATRDAAPFRAMGLDVVDPWRPGA
jgi:toxin FitB